MCKEEQGRGALHITAHILAGALVSLLSGVAILVAAAWGISEGWIGEALTAQITVAACVFGGLVGGFSAARKHCSRRLVIGAAVGICFFLFLFMFSCCYEVYDTCEHQHILVCFTRHIYKLFLISSARIY